VKFIPPREGWYSFGVVGKGLSTLSHIPLNLNKNYWKKFLDCTMSITPGTLINRLLNDDKVKDLQDAIIIYNNIYTYVRTNTTKHWFFRQKAKVYLASLEIGSAPASEIDQKAQLNRVTAYEILKILVHTGYARTYIKDKIKYFSVIKPKDLLEKQQDNINSLKNSITELENIYQKSPNKPKVSFYEGPEFLKNIYAATLENKEKVNYIEKLLKNGDIPFTKTICNPKCTFSNKNMLIANFQILKGGNNGNNPNKMGKNHEWIFKFIDKQRRPKWKILNLKINKKNIWEKF